MTLDRDVGVPPRDPNPEPEPDYRGFDVATGRRTTGGHMPGYEHLAGYEAIFTHHDKGTGSTVKLLVPEGEPLDRGPLLAIASVRLQSMMYAPVAGIELDGLKHALVAWQQEKEQD